MNEREIRLRMLQALHPTLHTLGIMRRTVSAVIFTAVGRFPPGER